METAQARLSLHLSKYHIVGNHMSRLKSCLDHDKEQLFKISIRGDKNQIVYACAFKNISTAYYVFIFVFLNTITIIEPIIAEPILDCASYPIRIFGVTCGCFH